VTFQNWLIITWLTLITGKGGKMLVQCTHGKVSVLEDVKENTELSCIFTGIDLLDESFPSKNYDEEINLALENVNTLFNRLDEVLALRENTISNGVSQDIMVSLEALVKFEHNPTTPIYTYTVHQSRVNFDIALESFNDVIKKILDFIIKNWQIILSIVTKIVAAVLLYFGYKKAKSLLSGAKTSEESIEQIKDRINNVAKATLFTPPPIEELFPDRVQILKDKLESLKGVARFRSTLDKMILDAIPGYTIDTALANITAHVDYIENVIIPHSNKILEGLKKLSSTINGVTKESDTIGGTANSLIQQMKNDFFSSEVINLPFNLTHLYAHSEVLKPLDTKDYVNNEVWRYSPDDTDTWWVSNNVKSISYVDCWYIDPAVKRETDPLKIEDFAFYNEDSKIKSLNELEEKAAKLNYSLNDLIKTTKNGVTIVNDNNLASSCWPEKYNGVDILNVQQKDWSSRDGHLSISPWMTAGTTRNIISSMVNSSMLKNPINSVSIVAKSLNDTAKVAKRIGELNTVVSNYENERKVLWHDYYEAVVKLITERQDKKGKGKKGKGKD